MATGNARKALSARRNGDSRRRETERFEQRFGEILDHATDVFFEKGYEGASMRDLSRATGMSLAGLYYYFESKERLLYIIQKHTFETVLRYARERLAGIQDPEQKIRLLIRNHLEYFLANKKAMTVLSHEDETLKNGFGAEVASLKREYYRLCLQVIEELRQSRPREFAGGVSSRIAVLGLFGMMNWIYTWHNPRTDANAEELAGQMTQMFLGGVLQGRPQVSRSHPQARKRRAGRKVSA